MDILGAQTAMPRFVKLFTLLILFFFSLFLVDLNQILPDRTPLQAQHYNVHVRDRAMPDAVTSLPLDKVSIIPQIFVPRSTERSIILSADQASKCTVPYLSDNEESITKHFKHVNVQASVKCAPVQAELTYLRNGKLYLDKEMLKTHYPADWTSVNCTYRYFDNSLGIAKTDVKTFSPWNLMHQDHPVQLTEDFVEVKCIKSNNRKILYSNIYTNFMLRKEKIYQPPSATRLSLHIIVLDSTSLTMFRRYMPKTRAYMENTMQSTFFHTHMKNGDNSMPNLMALLAGKRIHNQSDILLSDFAEEYTSGTKIKMDNEYIPWLWKLFDERGCATMFNDDVVDVLRGLFHYPTVNVTGFTKKPVDHYLRPFWVHLRKWSIKNSTKYCHGNRPIHQLQLDLLKDFTRSMANVCQFSFNFITELPHDRDYEVGWMDADFANFLESQYTGGHWNNSVVLIMGDHGHRMTPARYQLAGKIEERLPMLSFTFPAWFLKQYANLVDVMRTNAHRLTSHFDTHRTLVELVTNTFSYNRLAQSDENNTDPAVKGISLFQPIPLDRTCTQAHVPEQHCVCLEHNSSSDNFMTPKQINETTTLIMNRLNEYVDKHLPKFCANFSLHSILNVTEVRVNELVYHGCRNYYDGCYATFGEKLVDIQQYRIQLLVQPGTWMVDTVVQFNKQDSILKSLNPLILERKPSRTLCSEFCCMRTNII